MTSAPINYFDADKLAKVKHKWYSTETHLVEIVFGNDKYIIFGAHPLYFGASNAITPTFEEKLKKWDDVILCHKHAHNNKLFAIHWM